MNLKNREEAEKLMKEIFGEDVWSKGLKISFEVQDLGDCDENEKENCPCCEKDDAELSERLKKSVKEYEDNEDSDDDGKEYGTMTLEFEYDDEEIQNIGVEYDNIDEADTFEALASAVGSLIVGCYGKENVKVCYEAVSEFMQDLLLEVACHIEDE